MQNIKTYILERLRVTKSNTTELTFEQLRKAMIDCIARNGGSERFIVQLSSSEVEKNPIYTKLDDNKAPIKAILYIDDNYNQQGGWIKLLLDNYTIEISDNQGLHKFLSDESIERLIDYIETYDESVVEKLKVTKSSFSKMTLKEFAEERKSLNSPENNYKLTSKYDDKDIFINWVEKMLVEDGVVDEIPFGGFMKHILRFDGDILFDNIVDGEVDPPVSTEMYLTWGEAYMRIVTYYIKNDIFTEPGLVTEKLKVSTKKDKTDGPEVLFGKFVAYLANKPNKEYKNLVPEDLFYGLNFGPIQSTYLPKYFKNSWIELYNFFARYVDDIVEISYRYDTDNKVYYCWEVGDKYFEEGPFDSTLEELAKNSKYKDIKDAINDFIVNL